MKNTSKVSSSAVVLVGSPRLRGGKSEKITNGSEDSNESCTGAAGGIIYVIHTRDDPFEVKVAIPENSMDTTPVSKNRKADVAVPDIH